MGSEKKSRVAIQEAIAKKIQSLKEEIVHWENEIKQLNDGGEYGQDLKGQKSTPNQNHHAV